MGLGTDPGPARLAEARVGGTIFSDYGAICNIGMWMLGVGTEGMIPNNSS